MINQVVYDVFKKDNDDVVGENGLSSTSIHENNKVFTEKGLKFCYMNRNRTQKTEYDFTNEYHVIDNIVNSPRSFSTAEDNWFGFVLLSNDLKELVVVFRGTETDKEWIENFTLIMEHLEGEPEEPYLATIFNHEDLMVHVGFQSLYTQKPVRGGESPKETVHRLVKKHKSNLDKVTIVGHSLGGAMAQMCAIDLAHSKVLGDVPILGIAWASPRISNSHLPKWVDEMHPSLRVLRIQGSNDEVPRIGSDGNGPNHNLEMYLHNIDPTRDVSLMNKKGSVIPVEYCDKHNISPAWRNVSWPRTIYGK